MPGMKPSYTEDPNHPGERRLAGFSWLPNRARYLLIACLGEFVGTFLFLFFAFAATQVANNLLGNGDMDIQTLTYIALAFGFSLAVNVWIFFRISGGLFNPAVTVAMALIGAVGWLKAGLLIISQVLAGIASAGVVAALFPGPLTVRTTLGAGTSVVRGLFIEMFLTFELIFCIFMLAAEKHRSTFLAPVGIGLALFIAQMAGVLFTGGSLNPARSFGPDVVLRTFDGHHWIYWIGPLLGAILAVVFYRLIKVLEYETAHPDVDGDGKARYHVDSNGPPGAHDSRQQDRHATDGTDETEFASRFQTAKKRFALTQQPVPSVGNDTSVDSAAHSEPSSPTPALYHGSDGHQSQRPSVSIDHPNNRSRAQRTHYRMSSDNSYRSGPRAESGRSDA